MTTAHLLILVGGVFLLGTLAISGAGILLYAFRKPAKAATDTQFSNLSGRVAAIERRQEDLETDVVKKLRSANTRLQRAQKLSEPDEDEEVGQLLLDPPEATATPQEAPMTRRQVRERIRGTA
jgi:hypothetical protein